MNNNTEIKIEKGIPIPKPRHTGMSEVLKRMQVGDSVVVPVTMRPNLNVYADRIRIRVVTRKVDTDHIRVWRTE